MHDRLSRFDTSPGDLKLPPRSLYPSQPVQGLTCWFVRMCVGEATEGWTHEAHVWAFGPLDAVGRARMEFYGTASPADRQRRPLEVIEVVPVRMPRDLCDCFTGRPLSPDEVGEALRQLVAGARG